MEEMAVVKTGQTMADLEGEQLNGWTQISLVKPMRRTELRKSFMRSEEADPCLADNGEAVSF